MTITHNEADPRRVAVYGTLRRDLGDAWGMKAGTPLGLGKVRGRLYAHSSYPAVVPDEPGEVVVQVIDYNGLSDPTQWRQELAVMDRIEGVPRLYHRALTEVQMDDGTVVPAWIYYLTDHPTTRGMTHVPSGDWASRSQES